MSIPKHAEEIRNDRQAVAPYNFVPLPESLRFASKPPSNGFYDKDLLTGTITCELTNSTPIYVRAAQTLKEFTGSQVSKQPFYYGDKVVIPGSSIRGVLRTLVEVVSQSRIASVTDKQLFYRSVEKTSMGDTFVERMRGKVRPGFFHRDRYGTRITPAIAVRIDRDAIRSTFRVSKLYTGKFNVPREDLQHKSVFVRLHENALSNTTEIYDAELFDHDGDNLEDAVLVITGDMKSKDGDHEKREFAFLKKKVGDSLHLSDEQVELLEDPDQLTQYQQEAFQGKGRKAKGHLKDGDPVFYLVGENEQDVIGFGRAYMFRLPYKLSPAEMLPDELSGNPERYDLAEALFGYVPSTSESGRKAVATRLSIGDAILQDDVKDALLPEMRLKILSSPKPTSFQHYLTQEDPDNASKLFHYDTPKTKTTLRGHKFYWHKGEISASDFQANESSVNEHDTQYSPPVRPVKEGRIFTFEVRFENLRPEELGALLWVLDKANDKQYRLKLGMGKPYGLGSVAIHATPKLEDRFDRYQKLTVGDAWFKKDLQDSDQLCQEARQAFARWVLQTKDATMEQVDEQERIQELLIMLSWEGAPGKEDTRYMELKEYVGKQGKYKTKRPVLPLPHNVFGKWLKLPAPKVYTPVDIPPSQLKAGDIILAIANGKDGDDYVLTREQHGEDDVYYVRNNLVKPRDFALAMEGQELLLEVVKTKQEKGYWVVECQTVKQ